MALKPASTFIPSRSPIVSSDGMATFPFIKILQDWDTRISNGLSPDGGITGDIPPTTLITGRTAIGTILQFIDDGGQVLADGINFSRNYANKDTDHIADGMGSPLAGGKVAFSAMVASNPVAGQTIRFDGNDWLPVPIAEDKPAVGSQWINSYDDTTGAFTATQPTVADVVGAAPLANPTFMGTVTSPAIVDTGLTSGNVVTAGAGGLLSNGVAANLLPQCFAHNSATQTPMAIAVGTGTLVAGQATVVVGAGFTPQNVILTVTSANVTGVTTTTQVWVAGGTPTGFIVHSSSLTATDSFSWIAIG